MGWIKNRDKLHEASLASIKAISNNKNITSKNVVPPVSYTHLTLPTSDLQ